MAGDGVKQTLDAAGIVYDEDWFSLESLRSAVDPILNECCMVGAMNETNDADSNVASDEEGEDKVGDVVRLMGGERE